MIICTTYITHIGDKNRGENNYVKENICKEEYFSIQNKIQSNHKQLNEKLRSK